MSEALFFDRYGKYKRSKTSRKQIREPVFNRALVILVIALCLFLVGELVFHFIIAPRMTVRSITIKSDSSLSKEEILAIAGIEESVYYYNLDTVQIREDLEGLAQVREAVVEKVFPDALNITLYGRVPLAMFFFITPEGASIPLVIDDQGVVFEIGSGVSEWDLPVITGVKFQRLKVGMKLPDAVRPILQDLSALQNQEPDLFRLISEFRLISKSTGVLDILLYPVQYPVRLRLSAGLDPAVMRNALIILDLLAGQEALLRVRELDMRTGEVVYRIEEG
jgi:cell division protein FtsQ